MAGAALLSLCMTGTGEAILLQTCCEMELTWSIIAICIVHLSLCTMCPSTSASASLCALVPFRSYVVKDFKLMSKNALTASEWSCGVVVITPHFECGDREFKR